MLYRIGLFTNRDPEIIERIVAVDLGAYSPLAQPTKDVDLLLEIEGGNSHIVARQWEWCTG